MFPFDSQDTVKVNCDFSLLRFYTHRKIITHYSLI